VDLCDHVGSGVEVPRRTRAVKSGKPRVLVLGPFPPPLHGASLITQAFTAKLEEITPVEVYPLEPTHARTSAMRYLLSRITRHLTAIVGLLRHRGQAHTVYISLPGGLGVLYLLPLVLVARVLSYRLVFHHHSFAYLNEPSRSKPSSCPMPGRSSRRPSGNETSIGEL
jgi:hypothetical protein